MGIYLGAMVLDVSDMQRAIDFWTAALGYKVAHRGDAWSSLADPTRRWANLDLQPNPDPKKDVNRVHVDLFTPDFEREVERLVALGARRIPWDYPDGGNYVVLQDTEGNEFCVVKSDAPR